MPRGARGACGARDPCRGTSPRAPPCHPPPSPAPHPRPNTHGRQQRHGFGQAADDTACSSAARPHACCPPREPDGDTSKCRCCMRQRPREEEERSAAAGERSASLAACGTDRFGPPSLEPSQAPAIAADTSDLSRAVAAGRHRSRTTRAGPHRAGPTGAAQQPSSASPQCPSAPRSTCPQKKGTCARALAPHSPTQAGSVTPLPGP
jgi:hypothetical protein